MNLQLCPPPKAEEYTVNRLERDPLKRVRSTILIDMPNIRRAKEIISKRPLNWEKIAQSVGRDTAGSVHTTAHAFEMVGMDYHANGRYLSYLERTLRPLKASVHAHALTKRMNGERRIDIDQLMHDSMRRAVMAHFAEELSNPIALMPIQHRFVLFTGDGEFVDTCEDIVDSCTDRETGTKQAELELIVYSWEKSLSARLYAAATRVIYLDHMEGIFR